MATSSTGTALSDDIVRKYGVTKIFAPQVDDAQNVVTTSLSFHQQGEVCVAARTDGSISVINCLSGMVTKTILTKRYGVDLVKFTHHPDCILFSSMNNANDHRIRYHSLFDNKFLRYYSGHTAKVTSLMMHPTADEFLSCSLDGTIRLWDFRGPDARALIRLDHRPSVNVCGAYDTEGVVFGVYTDDHVVRMYDARNFADGPFAKFSLYDASITNALTPLFANQQAPSLATSKLHALEIQFSPDGNQLLVTTNRNVFLLLDAFEGHLLHVFSAPPQQSPGGAQKSNNVKLGSAFSADGAFVTVGTLDGRIIVYNATTGALVHTLPQGHTGAVVDVQWNPQRHMLGSVGGNSTVLWTPGNL